MLASILIIAFSLVLLVYWFRYSCILLLRNQAEEAAAPEDSRFHIGEVQANWRNAPSLDPLHASLQRDYAFLAYLMEHAAGLELQSFEDRLLVFDFHLMRYWYGLTKIVAPTRARQALGEMATVLAVLVGKIGERARANGAA